MDLQTFARRLHERIGEFVNQVYQAEDEGVEFNGMTERDWEGEFVSFLDEGGEG